MAKDQLVSPALKDDPFGLCGTILADKYRIESVVGAGGFGVVYRGVHTGFDEPIAVKCLKLPGEIGAGEQEKFVTRLRDEGRVLHRLSKLTSGIVQALDVGAVTTAGGWVPYLVLEWLDGQTLAQLMCARRTGRDPGGPGMPLEQAIDLLGPAAQALGIAHRQKVAHRDVKPENIFVTEVDGRRTVKILDFGIAKVLTQHASFAATATARASAFTPSYGAPEQFNKKRGATGPWTDVFALALVVVELVAGKSALDGDDPTQLYIAAADPASRPTLRHHGVSTSDAVEEVLAQALAVDPGDRYQDAAAFWNALREAIGRPRQPIPAPDSSETGEFVDRHEIALDIPLSAKPPLAAKLSAKRSQLVPSESLTEPEPASDTAVTEPAQTRQSPGFSRQTDGRPARRGSSLPWLPFTVGLSLAGAAALYWQLRSIGPTPVVGPLTPLTATASADKPHPAIAAATAASAIGASAPTASASAAPAPNPPASATASAAQGAGGAAPTAIKPPDGMALITPPAGQGRAFFIDKSEVTTKAYGECFMAGYCTKAVRVTLTGDSARALGLPVEGIAEPDKLAAAWETRCNQRRGADDHPINCVGYPMAETYCEWKKRRLPTSAEWTLAAAGSGGRRYPWGEAAPDCSFACYALNGDCLNSASEDATCAVGSHKRDATPEGVIDLAGDVAEWVSDRGPQSTPGGPPWHLLRGGSFLDSVAGITTQAERSLPPATAHVSIGFRCALDAPVKP